MSRCFLLTLTALVCGDTVALAAAVNAPAETYTFERHIRPIFKAHCFQCHGEASEKEGNLDVRLKRLLITGGDSGPAIVPGKPDESYLLERIAEGDMPPGDKKVSKAEQQLLHAWIQAGAATARPEPETLGDDPIITEEERAFWSFQPIRRPALPQPRDARRATNAIDLFLLERLNAGGVSFSERADRLTLLRRATFDLIGLPPTPEEIDTFLADTRPNAYQLLIDRLLSSPHYGERWGRHWLDVAGYSDSEGYVDEDTIREHAYKYRDYVIRSFNANKPFDLFIVEQLAGDETIEPPYQDLAPESIEKLAATGFLRMAPDGTSSLDVDRVIASNDVLAETIKIASSALMGLTVGCAQCHDHRYDPISQSDYYRLRAVFEPAFNPKKWRVPDARRISLLTEAERAQVRELEEQAKQVDAEYNARSKEFREQALERELQRIPEKDRDALRVAFKTKADERTDPQRALLKLYAKIANYDRISIDEFDWELRSEAMKTDAAVKARRMRAVAATRARALEKVPAEQRELVTAAVNMAAEKRSSEQVALLEQYPAVAVTAESLAKFDPDTVKALERESQRAESLRTQISKSVLIPLKEKAEAIRAKKPKPDFVRALTEVPDEVPATHLFFRGDHNEPRQALEPAEPTILVSYDPNAAAETIPVNDESRPTTGRRLAFARRLTSGKHPLTARVLVNRMWMHHFGRGIVGTPADFGLLGDRPSHPQLLDWLADEFMQSGWDLKHLHRLMMTSTVYRQSSRRRPELSRADPENRLYGRMPVRRIEAEVLRDSILAVSGDLNRALFGEPIPVREDSVGQIVVGPPSTDGDGVIRKVADIGEKKHRRSLYILARRSQPLSVLESFDAPEMAPNCSIRTSSTVAPQALLMMNSLFSSQYADDLADRIHRECGDDRTQQVLRAWKLTSGSIPTANDTNDALTFLAEQTEHFQQNPVEGSKRSAEMQALSGFCHAMMCSNAFLYVD